jgi:hypothetical protein
MEMGLGRSLTAIVMMILETSNSILVIFLPARWSRRSQKCGASKRIGSMSVRSAIDRNIAKKLLEIIPV